MKPPARNQLFAGIHERAEEHVVREFHPQLGGCREERVADAVQIADRSTPRHVPQGRHRGLFVPAKLLPDLRAADLELLLKEDLAPHDPPSSELDAGRELHRRWIERHLRSAPRAPTTRSRSSTSCNRRRRPAGRRRSGQTSVFRLPPVGKIGVVAHVPVVCGAEIVLRVPEMIAGLLSPTPNDVEVARLVVEQGVADERARAAKRDRNPHLEPSAGHPADAETHVGELIPRGPEAHRAGVPRPEERGVGVRQLDVLLTSPENEAERAGLGHPEQIRLLVAHESRESRTHPRRRPRSSRSPSASPGRAAPCPTSPSARSMIRICSSGGSGSKKSSANGPPVRC